MSSENVSAYLHTMFSLEGKVALVTGSSRGLGRSFAEALARAGAKVVMNGRSPQTLKSAVDELKDAGLAVHGFPFDVTDAASIETAVSRIEAELGPIEILVNNAGVQKRAPLEDTPEENWDYVMNGNLKSVFLVSKRVVKGMIERRRGKIVNICSMTTEHARNTIAPYGVSKTGVRALTQSMATEWGKYNIQANAIGPGYFATPMNLSLKENKEFDSWLCGRTPMGRWGEPEEMCGLLVYLASPASSFTTGQVLYVDGGILATL